MKRVQVASQRHDGGIVARVFRGNEGAGDFFSLDIIGIPFLGAKRSRSLEDAQAEVDRLLKQSGHRCSARCGGDWDLAVPPSA